MADEQRPSPAQLWQQAGGGTRAYDRDRYLELLREHGHLIPGETVQPLPCGWPTTSTATVQRCDLTELPVTDCAHCRKLPDPEPERFELGPVFTAAYPGRCAECGGRVEPGDEIRGLGDGGRGYVHASCVDGA